MVLWAPWPGVLTHLEILPARSFAAAMLAPAPRQV